MEFLFFVDCYLSSSCRFCHVTLLLPTANNDTIPYLFQVDKEEEDEEEDTKNAVLALSTYTLTH